MTVVYPTDGVWSMAERNTYFLAAGPNHMPTLNGQKLDEGDESPPMWILVAVNDVNPDHSGDMRLMEEALDGGARILLDSGVFWLTNRHKRAHGITMDEALGLHPTEIDDFDWLFDRYVRLHAIFGDRIWGMIELDQGGAERKRETRARLHDLGINPIPVYHPLNDGWDYFDELAEQYDRICIGNVVQANSATRQRLLMTAYERKRKYPHLWIHLLGYSQNEWLNACPVESCDSSSWLTLIRWAASAKERAMMKAYGNFPTSFLYRYPTGQGAKPEFYDKSVTMSAASWRFNHLNWAEHLNRLEEVLGTDEFR